MNNTVPIEHGEFVGQPVEVPAMRVVGVPPGYALVPIEPTIKMMAAAGPAIRACFGMDGKHGGVSDVWAALLGAAPSPITDAPAIQPEAEKADAVDAKRYRWLTAHAYIGECFIEEGVVLEVQNTDRRVPISGSVDAAIDAAIAFQEKQP
jgi:hypothetical protein